MRAIVRDLDALPDPALGEAEVSAALRRAKGEASFLIALRDLFGAADPARTTADLSDLADAAVRHALRFLLLDLDRKGQLRLPDRAKPEEGCGLFILGMGKLGAHELNYSSDIDLVLLFEPEAPAIPDPTESVETFSRLARRLVRMLGERTRDGYVFRTDLRLRPDPSAMPLAVPVPTALVYYETAGRDWERAAMIKARVVAGDRHEGERFQRDLAPFVWRRYLDYVAIADIRAMKGRIDRHRGFGGIAVEGQNVKLGPGGIREVEFFAQAQQLIAGGRVPSLRVRRTDEALAELARLGWIEGGEAESLTHSYWFLRRVEHAVQMVADEQTHTLPTEPAEIRRIALLCNFPDAESFREALVGHLEHVADRFASLFADDAESEEGEAVLSALGDAESATAIEWLGAAGYRRPADIARVLRGWGEGRPRATRSEAAREPMRQVLPSLLAAFARAADPDAALLDFDRFLEGLPSGQQFFSLIRSNPRLLDLLALAITAAPHLAETISRRPHVFDALLDPAFFREMPSRGLVAERLALFLADARDFEERLLRLRIFAAEQRFLVGVRLLSGTIEGNEAGRAYADLADVLIGEALAAVEREFAGVHGRVAAGRLAVLGLGRLGSFELTAGSDVDLMLLYDHDAEAEASDGERPLPVSTYYMRLTQRLIGALTARMADGVLYEVDFRLRPSGNKGPLATHVDAFRRYQSEAWTWERQALTRARVVAGDGELRGTIEDVIETAIRDHAADPLLAFDISDMRARLDAQKPSKGPLDLKHRPGGTTDLEFLAQWAILAGRLPLALRGVPTADAVRRFCLSLEGEDARFADTLAEAAGTFERIVQILRLGPSAARVSDLPGGLAERLARALDLADAQAIEPEVARLTEGVRAAFVHFLPFRGAGEVAG